MSSAARHLKIHRFAQNDSRAVRRMTTIQTTLTIYQDHTGDFLNRLRVVIIRIIMDNEEDLTVCRMKTTPFCEASEDAD
jgi:hypothetical protein